MRIKAIVYTSNTGFTARYAALLGERAGLPVWELSQAKGGLARREDVLYLGWLCAGGIKGLKKARRLFRVRAVCAVGIAPPESGMLKTIAERNQTGELPLFYLRGGYDGTALRGIHRLMMSFMEKTMAAAKEQDPQAREMLDAIQNGADWVEPEQLKPVLSWLEGER